MFFLYLVLTISSINLASGLNAFSPVPVATSAPAYSLNKRSTALDVLKSLNHDKQLAPYAGSGGVAVVTGGSSGIGACTVETLALAGMRVVLCARDAEVALDVVNGMDTGADKSLIRIQQLDLADLDSVQRAATQIIESEGGVDLLVNNAGIMALPKRELTAQNFEMQLGTNHVGHFFLTRKLLPHVKQGGRIVTVASTAHSMAKGLKTADLNYENREYAPWDAYGQSKLANILFAKGLQDRLKMEQSDIVSVSLHPGVIRTNLWRHNDNPLFRMVSGLIMDKSLEQGAATSVYCSLADASRMKGGGYYEDCQLSKPNNYGEDKDEKLRNGLWQETEGMIETAGFPLPEKLRLVPRREYSF